jgi:hypothetical protein
MSNVVHLKRRPRPLRKTYQPTAPYEVERQDQDDGSITFIVMDARPDSFRDLCYVNDDVGGNPYAKHDAEQIARALNMMIALGKETLPKVKMLVDCDLADLEDFDDV